MGTRAGTHKSKKNNSIKFNTLLVLAALSPALALNFLHFALEYFSTACIDSLDQLANLRSREEALICSSTQG